MVSKDLLMKIEKYYELNSIFDIDLLLDELVELSLIPPKEICDILTYTVRIFTGSVSK
jgi:hypothetical protein